MIVRSAAEVDGLVRKAAAGDARALGALLVHFQGDLLASIRRKIGRRTAGALISPEDVLQETWTAAARSAAGIEARGGQAFLAWLKTIARSRLINMLEATNAQKRGGGGGGVSGGRSGGGRRATTGAAGVDPATVNALVERLAAGTERPSVVIRKREALARTAKALAAVETGQRTLIDMHIGRGMTHAQVARQTGKTEGAVKAAIQRALAAIRKRLEGPEA
ncbi:MAG: RNA polymerase sigma factor [Phycisphaerales bacterium]